MKRLLVAITVVLLSGLTLTSHSASADVNNFTITNFSADETLSNADKQGELHIVEKINVNFTDQNHGIIRAIPLTYRGQSLTFQLNSVTSSSGAPVAVSKSTSNDNQVLKIGDANRTVTGAQEYTIDYRLHNVISFYKDHDELYWDVNGDQWEQPFTQVSVQLHLPSGLQTTNQAPQCFAGAYGANSDNCQIKLSGNELSATTSNLAPRNTLTYVVGFQTGYFQPATFLDRLRDKLALLIELLLPPLVAFVVGFSWWLRRGRDAKGRGTIVPQYDAPAGVSPLQAGTIIDFKVDNRDITATYIDLARRGYIKIIENRQDRILLSDKVSYTLELTNADYTGLDSQEVLLMTAMFTTAQSGEVISLEDKKAKLSATAINIRKSVDTLLTDQGYFKQSPYKFAAKSSGAGVIVIIAFFALGHGGTNFTMLMFGVIVAMFIFFAFVRIMPARTAKGVEAKEHLEGLKLYMNVAEKDRYEKLEAPEAAYAAGIGEPQRTVELFEKLLPYTVALGVENQWAGKFNDIYRTPPDWYSGNWTAFNAGYLAGSLNNGFAPALSSSFAAPSNSSSSGFGGGGFSGGGGGGGGGGGW